MRTSRRAMRATLALVAVFGLAACGSSNKSSDTTTTAAKATTTSGKGPDAAKASTEIEAAFNSFLSGETADAAVVTVCGASGSTEFKTAYSKIKSITAAQNPEGGTKATNVKATVEGNNATFTYDLAKKSDGQVLLPAANNSPGDAKFIDGKWCITPVTVCDLSTLGAPDEGPACTKAAEGIKLPS